MLTWWWKLRDDLVHQETAIIEMPNTLSPVCATIARQTHMEKVQGLKRNNGGSDFHDQVLSSVLLMNRILLSSYIVVNDLTDHHRLQHCLCIQYASFLTGTLSQYPPPSPCHMEVCGQLWLHRLRCMYLFLCVTGAYMYLRCGWTHTIPTIPSLNLRDWT